MLFRYYSALEKGNALIFNDVLPKLKSLYNGPVLKGEEAFKWDQQALAEEQSLVYSMYDNLSEYSYKIMSGFVKKTDELGKIALLFYPSLDDVDWNYFGDKFPLSAKEIPAFNAHLALRNTENRWRYGLLVAETFKPMKLSPSLQMPNVPLKYRDGGAYKEGVKLYNDRINSIWKLFLNVK